MARKKQEINSKSGDRLKQLCAEMHITQKQLSQMSGVSENTLSKISTGRGPLTPQIAQEIVRVCPLYSTEWLIGDTDYKSMDDENIQKIIKVINKSRVEGTNLLSGLAFFLSVTEYKMDVAEITQGSISVEEVLAQIKQYCTIEHKGRKIALSIDEVNSLENEILEHIEIRLKYLFKQKETENN